MTNIIAGPESTINIDGLQFQIRNTEQFNIETFSLPPKQPFPTKHYEAKTFSIIGAIGSGKSTLSTKLYANCCKQLWGDNIDFFDVKDLWGTLEAVKQSRKLVHYMQIDDSGPLFDCRNPMGNMLPTQMYWEIRHELKNYARASGGNAGGLVIIPIIIQDFMGLDKRIRQALAFSVFKTFDPIVPKLIPDETIIKALKTIKDQSVRCCNWEYRKLAVGVDAEEKYTLFYCDTDSLPYVPFTTIIGENIYEKQRDYLVQYLVDNVDLDASRDYVRGKLHFEVDSIKKSGEKCRITKDEFSEIITRAKTIKADLMKKRKIDKEISGGWDIARIVYFRDTLNLSYEHIEKNYGIPHTTCQRLYNKFIDSIQETEAEI